MNTQDKNSHPDNGSPAFLAVPLHEYERIRSELEEVRRELDALRTPAKPRWRLLERGEIIEPDDEFAVTGSCSGVLWRKTGCAGEAYDGYRHAPHRRLIGPGDHDPEECPSCGRRKINHWSLGWTCEDCDLGFYDPYDDGLGIISFNPNLNPNALLASTPAPCRHCEGKGYTEPGWNFPGSTKCHDCDGTGI